MKDAINRVSIPSIVLELLWTDDEFYRDVSANKKVSSSGKFPRCDQWCDTDGFHMAFALAGYSPMDLTLETRGDEIFITGIGTKLSSDEPLNATGAADDDYPSKAPNLAVQKGMIVRGIARRNFKSNYFINSSFDVGKLTASMSNGLLEIVVPRKTEEISKLIKIKEI